MWVCRRREEAVSDSLSLVVVVYTGQRDKGRRRRRRGSVCVCVSRSVEEMVAGLGRWGWCVRCV